MRWFQGRITISLDCKRWGKCIHYASVRDFTLLTILKLQTPAAYYKYGTNTYIIQLHHTSLQLYLAESASIPHWVTVVRGQWLQENCLLPQSKLLLTDCLTDCHTGDDEAAGCNFQHTYTWAQWALIKIRAHSHSKSPLYSNTCSHTWWNYHTFI